MRSYEYCRGVHFPSQECFFFPPVSNQVTAVLHVARLLPPGAQGGLPSHDAMVEKSEKYECYKSFDIEFETKDSKAEFLSVWDEVMEFRRKERARIDRIQEEMAKQTFTGKQAIRQWF